MSVTCGRSVAFSEYSGFVPRYSAIWLNVAFKHHNPNPQLDHGRNKFAFTWGDDDVFCLLPDKPTRLYLNSAMSHRCTDRHGVALIHTILTPSKQILPLAPKYCIFFAEAIHIICKFYGITRPSIEFTIYWSEHSDNYIKGAVKRIQDSLWYICLAYQRI